MSKEKKKFRLVIPLDASQIEDFDPGMALKVLAIAHTGEREMEVVRLADSGEGVAELGFEEAPGEIQVLVGPETASEEELEGLQTIRVNVPARQWEEETALELSPIVIGPYFWHWWKQWCRTFTIRGRVLCPNGDPVPGAKVCAKDVDRFFIWSSTQEIGCAVTDSNGAFEITFRWCCGWWPWWWLRRRFWEVDPVLWGKVQEWLHEHELAEVIPFPGPRPDPWFLEKLLELRTEVQPGPRPPVSHMTEIQSETRAMMAAEPTVSAAPKPPLDIAHLEQLRPKLATILPKMIDVHDLKLYPWYPWLPWWDCNPDVIFSVTQFQGGEEVVLLNETPDDTRWNVGTDTNVILVASRDAWCVAPAPDCADGNCMAFTTVCGDAVDRIGGNLGAPALPRGYLNPGLASNHGDRPYADVITIHGTSSCLTNVDYYEFEWSNDGGSTWNAMPPEAIGAVVRGYIDFDILAVDPPNAYPKIPFVAQHIDGKYVIETIAHYEATHPVPNGNWGNNRVWAYHRDRLFVWKTMKRYPNNTPLPAPLFADGEYILRVVGYDLIGGHLQNRRILTICQQQAEARLALRLDNRLVTVSLNDPYGAPCGSGTVHQCTDEPATGILDTRIIHDDGSSTVMGACNFVKVGPNDQFQVDFIAYDPDGHLSYFTLDLTSGDNQHKHLLHLLNAPGVSLVPLGGAPAPAAAQTGPNYPDALSQGATSPIWRGGAMRLTMPASLAFPEACSYQLELRAYKRTIVNCNHSLWPHHNLSERSFAVMT